MRYGRLYGEYTWQGGVFQIEYKANSGLPSLPFAKDVLQRLSALIKHVVRFGNLGPVESSLRKADFDLDFEYTHGSVRSEDAVPFPHPKTQYISLALLPSDPHLARAYQFPAIHPESSRLHPQVHLPVR